MKVKRKRAERNRAPFFAWLIMLTPLVVMLLAICLSFLFDWHEIGSNDGLVSTCFAFMNANTLLDTFFLLISLYLKSHPIR